MNSTQILHIRNIRFPCPYAGCRRQFKSQHGLTYHKRTRHRPSEPLEDTISELDKSIFILPDGGSSDGEPNFESNSRVSSS